MKIWQRIVLGLALAALSAALFTLAFPPYDLWPLIFFGLVPMVVAQHRVLPRRLAGLALGVGIGGFFWGYFGGMFAGSVWYMRWLPLFIGLIATLIGSRDRAFHGRTGYRWFVLHGAADGSEEGADAGPEPGLFLPGDGGVIRTYRRARLSPGRGRGWRWRCPPG